MTKKSFVLFTLKAIRPLMDAFAHSTRTKIRIRKEITVNPEC